MNTEPFISIITPTLNSANSILFCLTSVEQQSYQNYEHIIIDGLSSDATIDIIHEYQTKHSNVFLVSEKDSGIYEAMNKGISLAKGNWLFFLGSDDRFFDDNVLLNIFNRCILRDKFIIYGNALINGDAGWARDGEIYDGEFNLQRLIKKNICHQTIFYNKSVFKSNRYNVKYNVCADWDMNLRLWAKYQFYYINQIITVFNGGNSSFYIENNYSDNEKWINIVKSYKLKLLSKNFTPFIDNILQLSCYFRNNKEYFRSFMLLLIYYVQKIRNIIFGFSKSDNIL